MILDISRSAFSLVAGMAVGAFYYGGLWWTLRRLVATRTPMMWMLASFLVRTALSMTGIYFASGGEWKQMVVCLLGFIVVRCAAAWKAQRDLEPGTIEDAASWN